MPIGWNSYPHSILAASQWEALYDANVMLVDQIIDDLANLAEGNPFSDLTIAGSLPRPFLTRYDEGFLRRFLMCMASVGLKLRLPGFHALGCTAEEIALRIMIDDAAAFLQDRGMDGDFGDWEELVFEDSDHRWLWDPGSDGIGYSDDTEFLGVANLRFEEWFVPFNPPRVVHPYVDDGPRESWAWDYDTDDAEEEEDNAPP